MASGSCPRSNQRSTVAGGVEPPETPMLGANASLHSGCTLPKIASEDNHRHHHHQFIPSPTNTTIDYYQQHNNNQQHSNIPMPPGESERRKNDDVNSFPDFAADAEEKPPTRNCGVGGVVGVVDTPPQRGPIACATATAAANTRGARGGGGGGGGGGVGRRSRGAHLLHLHATPHSDFCVVCGDRACSHHYYGVAACHGCKCFFWRSVKQQQQYICRYNGDCEIDLNHRNSCRFCRFKRCLQAGMHPEAVRMHKPNNGSVDPPSSNTTAVIDSPVSTTPAVPTKAGTKRPAAASSCQLHEECDAVGVDSQESAPAAKPKANSNGSGSLNSSSSLSSKRSRQECAELVQQLLALELLAMEMADFSENEAPKHELTLAEVFDYPEVLDVYRTQVSFQVRLRKVTGEEMEFCKHRALVIAYDYIRALDAANFGGGGGRCSQNGGGGGGGSVASLSVEDRVVLLGNAFAPFTIFNIATGTMQATKDGSLLCLPTGITVSRSEEVVANSFLSQKVINSILDTLGRLLTELAMDAEERAMLKAIVVLNSTPDTSSFTAASDALSTHAEEFIGGLRDRVHNALYQHCMEHHGGKQAAVRFAKLLHVLPKLSLLARDLVDHIRMVHTFPPNSHAVDPLFYQLFGDIFQRQRANNSDSDGSANSRGIGGLDGMAAAINYEENNSVWGGGGRNYDEDGCTQVTNALSARKLFGGEQMQMGVVNKNSFTFSDHHLASATSSAPAPVASSRFHQQQQHHYYSVPLTTAISASVSSNNSSEPETGGSGSNSSS